MDFLQLTLNVFLTQPILFSILRVFSQPGEHWAKLHVTEPPVTIYLAYELLLELQFQHEVNRFET